MKARVGVWMAPFRQAEAHTDEGIAYLQSQCDEVIVVRDVGAANAAEQMRELLPSLDAVVVCPWYHPPVTPEFWLGGKRMRAFAGTFDFRFSGWLDVNNLLDAGTTLIDTSRNMTPSVAEFALAMTLNLIRDIPRGIDLVRQGAWKDAPWDLQGFVHGDLTERHVGLAGFGSINRRLAELLTPFRCRVQTYDPYVSDDVCAKYGVEKVGSLQELAQDSEIFVVGLPPTPSTVGIINSSVIDALPTGALFILVTRMAVVEQEALWRRIETNELRAAVDVFAPEPPPVTMWARYHPHVLPTPHIAGGATYCHRRCFTTACQDVIAVIDGKQPVYSVREWDDLCYQGKLDDQKASS